MSTHLPTHEPQRRGPGAGVSSLRFLTRACLAVVLALAAWMRFSTLGRHSLWLDEIGQIGMAAHPLPVLWRDLAWHLSPPLDYWITHVVFHFTHDTAWLRLPAAVFSLAALGLIYPLARRLSRPAVGVLAVSLAAFAPLLFMLGQEVRMYSLYLCLATAAFYLVVRTRSRPAWGWLLAVNVLGLYTHYFFVFVVVLEAVLLLAVLPAGKKRLRPVLLVSLLSALALVPWVPQMLAQYRNLPAAGIGYALKPSLNFFVELLRQEPCFGQPPFKYWYGWVFGLGAVAVFLRPKRNGWLMLSWLALPVLGLWALSFLKSMVTGRNLIFIYPVYFLLMAFAAHRLFELGAGWSLRARHGRAWARRLLRTGDIVLLSVALGYAGWNLLPGNPFQIDHIRSKPPWRALGSQMDSLTARDAFVMLDANQRICLGYYYDFGNFGTFPAKTLTGSPRGRFRPTPGRKRALVIGRDLNWDDVREQNLDLIIGDPSGSLPPDLAARLEEIRPIPGAVLLRVFRLRPDSAAAGARKREPR